MYISLFLFVFVEATALFTGIAWRFGQFVVDSRNVGLFVEENRTNTIIMAGGVVCAVLFGLICGWTAVRSVGKAPNFLWLWGGGIIGALLGWAVSGQLLHLAPGLVLIVTAIVSSVGGILGVVVSGLVGGASQKQGQSQPSQGRKGPGRPAQPSQQPQMAMASYGPGGNPGPQTVGGPGPMMGAPEPPQDPEVEIKRLRKRLYQEAVQMAENPTSVSQSVAGTRWPEPQLFVVDPTHVALVVVIPCYLGQLTFFVVCPTGYPERPPVEVHIELLRQGGPPVQVNYDGRRLTEWKTGSKLANVFKDGFLQIESTVLG